MRNKSFPIALLAVSVLLGCTKDVADIPQEQQALINPLKKSSTAVVSALKCDLLSFKNQGPGINITSVSTDGGMWVTLQSGTTYPSLMNTATASAATGTLDMGTPNIMYPGGVGVANPGHCDGGASNNVALGNLLVLQRPGVMSHPLEADLNSPDSWIDITFPSAVTVNSIKVIDVEMEEAEGGTIALYGESGWITSYDIPPTCSNGVLSINLGGTANVIRVRLNIVGSMGFDDLSFCIPPTYPCTYTQGYWKNHPNAWPVNSLYLGTRSYTKDELLLILNSPVKGNGLISMAHQLITAKLNKAMGTNTTVIDSDIAAADAMIGSLVVPPVGSGFLHPSTTSTLNDKLDAYNRGVIGPGHCE